MKFVDLNAPPSRLTILVYGPLKSGKSSFIGSFPKPLILCPASEEGWDTLRSSSFPEDALYDRRHRPDVVKLSTPVDFPAAIREAGEILKKQPDRWRTIAVDTFTIVADDYLSHLETSALDQRQGKKQDGRLLYGNLNTYMKARIVELHKLPVHVIWSCHVKNPSEFDPGGGPMIPGRASAEGFPARCSVVLYTAVEQVGADIEYVAYAQHHKAWAAGSRLAGVPDRMVNPNYRQIAEGIGLKEGPIKLDGATPLLSPVSTGNGTPLPPDSSVRKTVNMKSPRPAGK